MIHYFSSTKEAYDACMCDENVEVGDTLVIEDEKVVGISDTWPIAITIAHGELHPISHGFFLLTGEQPLYKQIAKERRLPNEVLADRIYQAKRMTTSKGWAISATCFDDEGK